MPDSLSLSNRQGTTAWVNLKSSDFLSARTEPRYQSFIDENQLSSVGLKENQVDVAIKNLNFRARLDNSLSPSGAFVAKSYYKGPKKNINFIRDLLQRKYVLFISGGRNPKIEGSLDERDAEGRTDLLKAELDKGFKYLEIEGRYQDQTEKSFLVILPNERKDREVKIQQLENLAVGMNQDSIIVSLKKGIFGLRYLRSYPNEPVEGKFHAGFSYTVYYKKPADNYSMIDFDKLADSELSGNIYFSIHFLFDIGPHESFADLRNALANVEGSKFKKVIF
jgi:hypothetical protein